MLEIYNIVRDGGGWWVYYYILHLNYYIYSHYSVHSITFKAITFHLHLITYLIYLNIVVFFGFMCINICFVYSFMVRLVGCSTNLIYYFFGTTNGCF